LLVFIDDATGRLMQLMFAVSESAFAYFDALRGYLEQHGRPVAAFASAVTPQSAELSQAITSALALPKR
jgi:hypothetical protein